MSTDRSRIGILADDLTVGRLLEVMLRGLGQVEVFTPLSRGLRLMAQSPPFDVAVAQLRVARDSVANIVRTLGPTVPLVVVTAVEDREILHRAYGEGAHLILPMPVDQDQITAAVSAAASGFPV